LVVDLAQRRSHLVAKCAGHNHHVGLTRAAARRKAEALEVVARHRGLHHLDRAAGKPKGHPHERTGARPVDEFVGGREQEALIGKLVGKQAETHRA
jgi:Mn-dependent DtxR family transcriptional regulator